MCAFKFRLEPVVSLKKKVEDDRKTALARAKEDLEQKESTLVNLCGHQEACQDRMGSQAANGNLDVSQKLIYYAYMEKLAEDIATHAHAVEHCREDVETKRDLLLESSREKKTLEKLKDRMRARYVSEAKKSEQNALDETAVQFHRRKHAGKLSWKKE